MSDILDGFNSSQVSDHNPDFNLDRILAENKVSDPLCVFLTYLLDLDLRYESRLELVVEKAAKKVDPVEQLKTVISELDLPVGDFLGQYTLRIPPIAPIFRQHLDDLKNNSESNTQFETFPNVIALKIKEVFFDDDPLAFEKLMNWKRASPLQIKFDWQKLFLFYGDDPFEVYFDAIVPDGRIDSDDIYERIWEKYPIHYLLNQTDDDIESADIDLRKTYKDCMEAGVKWHKKLLDIGKIKEAEKWEEKIKVAHYECCLESQIGQLADQYFDRMIWQRLDVPGIKISPEDHEKWLEAAFNIGKTPYLDETCSSETAERYFKSSLNIIKWKPIHFGPSILSKYAMSEEQKFYLTSDNLPAYWYASPYREEWLNCLEKHLQEVDIPKKLKILKYLLSFTCYEIIEDNTKALPEEWESISVDKKTQKRWAYAGKPIGEIFLKGKLKLEFNELITYFDLLFKHRKKFEFSYEDLIPYADKIMAFSRPQFKAATDNFSIHECEAAYRVLLTYASDKLLKNLLHTFRKSPAPCSGEGLEFGVGANLGLGGSSDRYPLHWWVSIMIHNCLQTPYLKLNNLKPQRVRHEPVPDKPNYLNTFDMNDNRIGNDGFAEDSQGNKLDKDGNKLSGNELKEFSKPLRQTFADFCFKGLRLKKGEKLTKGKYNESQCMEPDPFWRQGFIFALSEIGLDLGGKAHRTLNFISEHDPDEHVRKYAKNAYKSIRRKQHSNEDDPVKGMLIAFWWLRLAQRNSMSEDIDRPAAARVRRNELRYSQKISFSLLRQ